MSLALRPGIRHSLAQFTSEVRITLLIHAPSMLTMLTCGSMPRNGRFPHFSLRSGQVAPGPFAGPESRPFAPISCLEMALLSAQFAPDDLFERGDSGIQIGNRGVVGGGVRAENSRHSLSK
jgi:hypothetical protein